MKKNSIAITRQAAKRSFFAGIYLAFTTAFVIAAILLIMHITAKPTSADDQVRRYKYYTSITVEKGESLWSIADTYAGSEYGDLYEYIDEVMEINGLKNTEIKAGYHLCIPYYSEEYKN